jgi:aspartate aminotransferase
MVAPGNGFYATPELGHDEIRVAYVLEVEKLVRASHILLEGMERYLSSNAAGQAGAAKR